MQLDYCNCCLMYTLQQQQAARTITALAFIQNVLMHARRSCIDAPKGIEQYSNIPAEQGE